MQPRLTVLHATRSVKYHSKAPFATRKRPAEPGLRQPSGLRAHKPGSNVGGLIRRELAFNAGEVAQ